MKQFLSLFTLPIFFLLLIISCGEPETPDPDPTYTADIASIISTNCLQCHNSDPNPAGGFTLETYTSVKNQAQLGILNMVINDPVNPMPPAGLMSQTDRDKIQLWITTGLAE